MCSMRAATDAGAASRSPGRSVVGDGRPSEAEAAQGGAARFDVGELVYEPERERVGRVASVHLPAPVLYRISLPEGGPHGYAYDEDLRPATPEQIDAFTAKQRWSPDHGPTR